MFSSFKIPILVIAAVAVLAAGTFAYHSVYDSGFQRGADSVGVVDAQAKVAAITHVKDSLLLAYEAGKPAVRDSDAAVRRDVSALTDRVARLRATPVPTVAVSPAIDSTSRTPSMVVTLVGDTTLYRVHVNVGHWIQLADSRLAVQDSLIGDLEYQTTVRFPALLAMRDGQNRLLERTIVTYDSLGDAQRGENAVLRRRVAQLTPGKLDGAKNIVLYALAAVGVYEGVRRATGN